MRIYVIGPTGSGKTTLSKILSKKYNIKRYELDCIVFDDQHDHRKRSDEQINALFNKILEEDSWIIEDVGRAIFIEGRVRADQIYYLKLPKRLVYMRVIKRWIKQRRGREEFNYPPTFAQLFDMLKITYSYFKKENLKLKSLDSYIEKVQFLGKKQLNDLEKRSLDIIKLGCDDECLI